MSFVTGWQHALNTFVFQAVKLCDTTSVNEALWGKIIFKLQAEMCKMVK